MYNVTAVLPDGYVYHKDHVSVNNSKEAKQWVKNHLRYIERRDITGVKFTRCRKNRRVG